MSLIALFLLPPVPVPTAQVGHDAVDAVVVRGEEARAIDRYLSRLTPLGFSGSVLVGREGEVLLSKGYGLADRGGQVAMTPATVLPLGSISKHFTAAAILRLEMAGELSREDKLERFFDDVPADKRAITVHHLLCHASGLPEGGARSVEAEDYVREALALETDFPPGAGFGYSNVGYGLLAAIVARVSGATFEEYLAEALFEPAGMRSIGFRRADWSASTLAHGYIDGQDTGTLPSNFQLGAAGTLPANLQGGGGLSATAHDLWLWNLALDRNAVLSEEAYDHMTRSQGGSGYGYGIGVHRTPRGTLRLGHNGSNDVFSADFRRLPDEDAFLYAACNDADVYAFDVTPRLETLLFGGEVPLPPDVKDLGSQVLAGYAGRYVTSDGAVVVVAHEGEALALSSEDAEAAGRLFPVRPGQEDRRRELSGRLGAGFELAFEGEFEELHGLLNPHAPFEVFAQAMRRRLASWSEEYGEPEEVLVVPGRNRFGEIALVAQLGFERGRLRIEYSFGDDEVGSIRTMDELPRRIVRPEATEASGRFFAYDVAAAEAWRVAFELDDDDRPVAVLLRPNGPDGYPLVARRAR